MIKQGLEKHEGKDRANSCASVPLCVQLRVSQSRGDQGCDHVGLGLNPFISGGTGSLSITSSCVWDLNCHPASTSLSGGAVEKRVVHMKDADLRPHRRGRSHGGARGVQHWTASSICRRF